MNFIADLTLFEACRRYPLTKKEREVLIQVFTGKTDKEIAQTFGSSPRTINHQLQSIYRKLGVRNRTEAIGRLLSGKINGATEARPAA